MNPHTRAQLAQIRRKELTAEVTYHRQIRRRRACTRTSSPRPLGTLRNWLATGQL